MPRQRRLPDVGGHRHNERVDVEELLSERLRSHRLTSPAASVADAASDMLATQAQDFSGGRWALGVRSRGSPTLRDLDAAFDRGTLVRAWTQRGTLHILPPKDLAWVLSLTGDRQHRQAASRHRTVGLDGATLHRAETAVVAALRGGNRLTRAEMFSVLQGLGIDPKDQRGVHVLYVLAVRGLVCMGPIVPRERGPTREQYVVLTDEWVRHAASPANPEAEFFVRYIDGHGPASPADFAWWSGLPIGTARRAAEASADRLDTVDVEGERLYISRLRPRRSSTAPEVLALPPFEEYFLSYANRAVACPPEFVSTVAQGGMMRPVIVARGKVVGLWTHSLALARRRGDPPELFVTGAATDAEVAAALERYRDFVTG